MSFEEKTPVLFYVPDDVVERAGSKRVLCTISGNTCSERDGARVCSCVGCTVWRSREASAIPAPLPSTLEMCKCVVASSANVSFKSQRLQRGDQ